MILFPAGCAGCLVGAGGAARRRRDWLSDADAAVGISVIYGLSLIWWSRST